jgi:D-ribose pyranose/furanose isomerase RbsD
MNKIKKALGLLVLNYAQNNDVLDVLTNKAKVYENYLAEKIKNEEISENEALSRLEEIMRTSKWFPTLAEILECTEEELEVEWLEFKATMNNNLRYEVIPDLQYTIKKELGLQRCNDITTDQLPWLKKDFMEVYKLVKKGKIKLQSDPNKGLKLCPRTKTYRIAPPPPEKDSFMISMHKALEKELANKKRLKEEKNG